MHYDKSSATDLSLTILLPDHLLCETRVLETAAKGSLIVTPKEDGIDIKESPHLLPADNLKQVGAPDFQLHAVANGMVIWVEKEGLRVVNQAGTVQNVSVLHTFRQLW